MKNLIVLIFYSVVVFFIGYLFGFSAKKTTVEYVPLPPIEGHFTATDLEPISAVLDTPIIYKWVYLPANDKESENGQKTLLNEANEAPHVDTIGSVNATVQDWNTKRTYKKTLFNKDDLGELSVEATVQYNELRSLSYRYDPVQKTITKEKLLQPFIRASYNSMDQITVGGGLFVNKMGVDAFLIQDKHRSGIGFGLSYRF